MAEVVARQLLLSRASLLLGNVVTEPEYRSLLITQSRVTW
jgi:hypothetical protein